MFESLLAENGQEYAKNVNKLFNERRRSHSKTLQSSGAAVIRSDERECSRSRGGVW